MADVDSTLDQLAHQLLAAVVDYYPTDGPFVLPDRRYVADASPAWDEPQVTVQCLRVYPCAGDPNVEVSATVGELVQIGAEFGVQIVRCRATLDDEGDAPTVAEIEENAIAVNTDALTVLSAVVTAYRAGRLSGCGGVGWGGWSAVEPSDLTSGLSLVRLLLE